jgi:hypothetical protein
MDIWGGKGIWKLSTRCSIDLADSTLGHVSRSGIQARNASYITVDIENLSGRFQPNLQCRDNGAIYSAVMKHHPNSDRQVHPQIVFFLVSYFD